MMKKILMVLVFSIMLLAVGCGNTHEGQVKTPSGSSSQKGKDYLEVEKTFKDSGFTNIKFEKIEDLVFGWLTKDGEVDSVSVAGDKKYASNEWVSSDAEVIIYYHTFPTAEESKKKEPEVKSEEKNEEVIVSSVEVSEEDDEEDNQPTAVEKEDDSVYYSSNTKATYKEGNAGVYSYRKHGNNYDQYIIIDFDDGFVYFFIDGEGNSSCDKVAMVSGSLNDVLIVTYHDNDGSEWSYGLHFTRKNQPDQLIQQDVYGFEDKFLPIDLKTALALKAEKTINEY